MDITVNKTLHGYDNGHSLLQGSTRLSNDALRLMLSMSDMSGPGVRQGFESYLTGYPLRAEKTYVIARTWYAPEMKRPGCVWTHSLLIRNTDIGKIGSAISLERLFRRLTISKDFESYTSQMVLGEWEITALYVVR